MHIDPVTRTTNINAIRELASDNIDLQKQAAGKISGALQLKIREDGLARQIVKPINVGSAEFDRQQGTPLPVIVRDMQPDSAGAISVPLGSLPSYSFLGAGRYSVPFQRIVSERYSVDIKELETYTIDIQQIFKDLLLKDIMDEEDRKFFGASDITVGTKNAVSDELGARRYITAGEISRASLMHAMKSMAATNRNLNPGVVVVNNMTIWDIAGWGDRNEVGGDLSQSLLINGFEQTNKFGGCKWIVTTKKNLVANKTMYHFVSQEFLGDFFVNEDVTLETEKKGFMLNFFAHSFSGMAIANIGGVAKIEFTGTLTDWNA